MTGEVLGVAECWSCGRPFGFDPETVPSVWIDSATNLPPPDGAAIPVTASRRPICGDCVEKVVAASAAKGRDDPWRGRRGR